MWTAVGTRQSRSVVFEFWAHVMDIGFPEYVPFDVYVSKEYPIVTSFRYRYFAQFA